METRVMELCSRPADGEQVGVVRFLARQAILDLHGRVHGYELLSRTWNETQFRGDCETASSTMLDNTVLFGLGRLTCGLPAFVNCTAETLTGDAVHLLPAGMVVLEILETVEPTAEVVEACRRLKAAGFRLALDDIIYSPGLKPLLELVDYIKVDFVAYGAKERRALLKRIGRTKAAMIAEKVESEEQFEEARAEGFQLVQGYYFCRPKLMENRKVPSNRLSQIEILGLLHEESVDMNALAQTIERDPSLMYRLLRLVNSPVHSMQMEVRSVLTALIAIGESTFRRLATLAITSEMNTGQPIELLRMAFVRARFCELAARSAGLDEKEQYLLGMMSLLPAMLRVSPLELVGSLPLRGEIRRALKGENVAEREALSWLEGHERGNWEACDRIAERCGVGGEVLQRIYEQAAAWTESTLHLA